jgi:two-component system osmolarity sensor histidine kinase EnvZ
MTRIWPRSLLGRNVLLLIALVVASQLCAAAIYVVLVQRPRIDEAASMVAAQIRLAERLLPAVPEAERRRALIQDADVPASAIGVSQLPRRSLGSYVMRRFLARLASELPPDIQLRWEGGERHRIWVRLRVGDHYYWVASQVAATVDVLAPWNIVYLLLSATLLPALGAYLIDRRIAGPLQRLAAAAASVERGVWPPAVPLAGPIELSTVTEAFNRMVVALAEGEATRAEMLAGISHDIRTPLTKLRMALAAPEAFDAPIASAERFVEQIDLIVQQFIDFARGGDSEAAVPGNLTALIEQLSADYAGLGHPFKLELEPLPVFAFRPVAMQRLLMNLMHNAVLHAGVGLAVRTRTEGHCVVVAIEDRGPGVAAALLPLLKQPFRRGAQPNQQGGTGLGLAIAERIARQHGGSLELRAAPHGGLIAEVRLPCA